MLNIVVLDAYTLNPGDLSWDALSKLGKLTIYDRTDVTSIVERCQNADIVLTNKVPLREAELRKLPKLKYIVVMATGYNNIDIETTRELHIPVSNVKNYSTSSVAQHVFAMLLNTLNRVQYYDDQVKQGAWERSSDFCFYDSPIRNLEGMRLGILGYGDIGRKVAHIALSFGMKVLVHSRTKLDYADGVTWVDRDTLFKESEVLTLHAPLTDETFEIINHSNLNKMKQDIVIINTARGGLVNEKDLYDFLIENVHAYACIDVLNVEPPDKPSHLFGLQNCSVTPHQAWAGTVARSHLMKGIEDNINSFIKGQVINRVN
ncbi:MAG TPA: D-2-hydroxyacid dehydrogenase [Saprospiraceae bacterium]|nr:D-2-hydroxyacid dehydrogenase [Saprospiraceae bacterium]